MAAHVLDFLSALEIKKVDILGFSMGMMSMINGFETFDKPENRAKGSYDRLREVEIPVFIGQGKDDYMIPTVNSFVMQQRLPNGTLKVFPDSGHGFLYQHAEEFAEDVNKFLDAK